MLYLKKAIPQTGVPKKKMKEMIVRAIYVEMLGQDASFAYIKSVELCAATSITQKRAGYLTAALFLSPEHEFRFMLVNQIQRDMKSNNVLEVTAALIAVCKLVTEDMIPAVIGDVLNLLNHDMEAIRKKAVAAMHRFYQMDKRCVLDHTEKLRRILCDRDPCVMGATLPLFQAMVTDDAMQFKDLVPSFVSILKQIIEHRLPREFDYHRIPAPWIQMNLVRILAILGRGDQAASEGMYEVLAEVMKRADSGINVGYAVVYECVNAVIMIYPNATLMDTAATAISRFIRSDSHNLKYVGIKGLAGIVKDHPRYAADHQLAVIDCLEDPDETLKRKTLDLLYRMTNAVNVEFIVDKLLSFLASSQDDHFRSDLVNQISQCAERFAPSNAWYVQTIIKVFELAGDKVKVSVAQTLTQLIAEGAEEEEDDEDLANEKDSELRKEAVENFLILLDKPKLPGVLVQTLAWVLGEYGYLATVCTKDVIMDKLCALLHQPSDSATKATLITALSKLIAQHGSCPAKVLQTISFYSQSRSLDLQQRCLEVLLLLRNPSIMVDILPVDASCEDIEVDESLSFLNEFVQKALNYGAKPYAVPISFLEELTEDDGERKKSLNITPYAMPKMPAQAVSAMALPGTPSIPAPSGPTPLGPALTNPANPSLSIATSQGNQLLGNMKGAAQVWGKKPEPPPPVPVAATPPPVPASPEHEVVQHRASIAGTPGMWGQPATSTPTAVSPAPAPVAAAPAAPKVLSEKEKMAAALFGGMGGNKSSAATKRKSVAEPAPASLGYSAPATPTVVAPVTPVAAAHAPAPVADLMDSMDLLGLTPVSVAPVPSSSSSASVPLMSLDEFEMGLTSSPAPAPAPVAHQMMPNLLSPMPSMAPLPTTPPPKPTASLISDVFGDLDLTKPGSVPVSAAPEYAMAPLTINTQEFGKRWGMTRQDAKVTVSCAHWSRLDLPTLRTAVPPAYHHVESIPTTQEAIFASTVTSMGAVVLLHCKLNVNRRACDVIVKSTAQDIAQKEVHHIDAAITAFRG